MTGRFYILAGAVAAGVVVAAIGLGRKPSARTAETGPMAAVDTDAQGAASGDSVIAGEVAEVIDVPPYMYLRLRAGGSDVWAAVPAGKVATGQAVRIAGAMRMTNFQSPKLKRTFDTIYFGTLGGASGGPAAPNAAAAGESPHAAPGQDDPHAGSNPHGGAMNVDDVPVKKAQRAEGPLGHAIAELYLDRQKLAGKAIRVRGTVVKSTPAVFGHTFLHIRDGSGTAKSTDSDLAVTAQDSPAVGESVVLEGTLAVNKDLGSGIHYDLLLEDAKVIGK
jgi:hypothetical protein